MEYPNVDVAPIKFRLQSIGEMERDIDNQTERLEHLVNRMTVAGAQVMSDMPKGGSRGRDRFADYLARKEEMEKHIQFTSEKLRRELWLMEKVVSHLPRSDEKAVIQMRYFDHDSWQEITELIFGSRPDFDDKRDTYARRIHRLHVAALYHMASLMKNAG